MFETSALPGSKRPERHRFLPSRRCLPILTATCGHAPSGCSPSSATRASRKSKPCSHHRRTRRSVSPVFAPLRFVDHKLLEHAKTLAEDPSIAVRREVALALRNLSVADTKDIILTLAKQYQGEDRWYLEAIGTACTNKEADLFPILHKEHGDEDPLAWSKALPNSPGVCTPLPA